MACEAGELEVSPPFLSGSSNTAVDTRLVRCSVNRMLYILTSRSGCCPDGMAHLYNV
jgi:hypothetical protein